MATKYSLPHNAVWFVVGSSAGIGRAFAALVASNPKNYRLVAAARKTSALQFLPESENILKVTLDITSPDAIKDAVRRATDTFGRIDVFVNNAGYSLLGDTESTTDAQARALFETLFWGATNLTREALRVMREDNTKTGNGGGVVVYMSSPGGRVSLPGGSYYYAARFAMNGFHESLTKELDPDWNIHLMIAEPVFVKTEYLTNSIVITDRHPAYLGPKCGTNYVLNMLDQARSGLNMAGTPEVLAEVVVDVIENGAGDVGIPMRLPLGPEALGLIETGLKKQLEEIKLVTPFANRFVGKNGSAMEGFNDLV